jgi:hypothetical protein
VKLLDKLPENAKLLEGSTDAKFAVIAEGSSVKHSYVITFTAGGDGVLLPQASISYLADDKSTQVSFDVMSFPTALSPKRQRLQPCRLAIRQRKEFML